MAAIEEILDDMKRNPKGIRFNDLAKVCKNFFGDPRVNIQNAKGKAKPYQVKQVLQAIERLEVQQNG